MQFLAVVSLLAATALALPPATGSQAPNVHPVFDNANQYTLSQAQNKCGEKTTLSCCNHVSSVGDTTSVNYGLLNGLLGNTLSGPEGVGLLSGCTKLDVTALIGVNDLLNKQCQQNVACCQGTESTATGGLVNLALPCVALGSII
ncbi:hydrophobin family protein [Aspergillus clavatus NRRL 1]|uniref:Hydrophobin n=1 Tax=Aspergillus clavatus (strain ATCC 1007 / CBS 513.65 / DSM 816 / NCTC 3887 / NRRL 1 / QM 1276 / 107) TaxID=344612 RepID=A1CNA4_ASPCL|nr:conidial hydrophobin RodB [Aspergillus clavatus NRRL 1]EAW07125.1 conidial hydrophobin RodB [Aspergillus clavatus NRRL 1]